MPLRPTLLVVPSLAAAIEWPRRLAAGGKALAGLYPWKPMDLARAIAEPALLGQRLKTWDTGHDALIAAKLLAEPHGLRLPETVPRARVARTLARTLRELRRAGTLPESLHALAEAALPGDATRLHALADLLASYLLEVEGRFADPVTLLRVARVRLAETSWLRGASGFVVGDPELDPIERALVEALGKVIPLQIVAERPPASLRHGSLAAWAEGGASVRVDPAGTPFASLAGSPLAPSLRRLRERLFEAPHGDPVTDASVELLTAPGEAAEVRAIGRRLLRAAARGVAFEEMGIALARPDLYAPLFTDLLDRVGIPHKLHPSLPLRFGRSARSLLLLFRCRDLPRGAVMEFLTFAPIPFAEILGDGEAPQPARWDALSRDARIVSGLDRWIVGLRAHAEEERSAAANERTAERAALRELGAKDAEALLRVVELLNLTLDTLSGEAAWSEWSEGLRQVVAQWLGEERDREAVLGVIADLAGLDSLSARVPWVEVESVLEARFEWERLPLDPPLRGAVHIGALDAIAGLPFRLFAIPGLVEGGFPGVFRPDPLLLDAEREALAPAPVVPRPAAKAKRQLSLFDAPAPAAEAPADTAPSPLVTTQDQLREARRLFHRAAAQATETLLLSYPRADSRSGREKLPSLFFAAAAQALQGRPLSAAELQALTLEDDPETFALPDALDRAERDLTRVRLGGRDAALQIAAGSRFFRQSHLASEARASRDLTPYDGLVAFSPKDGDLELAQSLRDRLDPMRWAHPVSASRLARYASCGFQYFLETVLRLQPALEPEERRKLDPLERGTLFHDVAERFLREMRDHGLLPVRDSEASRVLVLQLADEALDGLVKGSPPRFTLLWERERRRFRETLLLWLQREAAAAERSTPLYFEVGFGMASPGAVGEPHRAEPLAIDIGDGRTLRVQGKIDRIDKRPDGTLLLRDYKTGKAPRDDGSIFRGGKQLQIPFYILAAAQMFPGQPVVEAFLDYVDAGRQVAVNPSVVTSDSFRQVLKGLVDAISSGVFVQDPAVCDWCDFTEVCGPKGLISIRRERKSQDPRLRDAQRLRTLG